ncbi:MAG: hypothetical protein IKQ66_04595 [Treponema sp.]|nr:hypothetical protein [Treponema sp.]
MKKIWKNLSLIFAAILISSVAEAAEIKYIEITSIQNAPLIKVSSVSDFESLMTKYNSDTVYFFKSTNEVLINVGGMFYSCSLKGYTSIDDYKKAETAGFKSSRDFYDAVGKGFTVSKDYEDAKSLGLKTYDQLKKYRDMISPIEKISHEKSLDKKNAVIYYFIQNLPKTESSLKILSQTLKNEYAAMEAELKSAINKYASVSETNVNGSTKNSGSKNNAVDLETEEALQYLRALSSSLYNPTSHNSRQSDVTGLFTEESLRNFFKSVDTSKLCSYDSVNDVFKKSF